VAVVAAAEAGFRTLSPLRELALPVVVAVVEETQEAVALREIPAAQPTQVPLTAFL
tara:strand:+ start:734 stop:901 length:168 start_codon:yes stop_codon:yes gene_type:complete